MVRVIRVGPRFVCGRRVGYIECVLEVAGRMLLGDEESVKVPEPGLDKAREFGSCLGS